jgi:Putative restriction endonuclease
MTLEEYLTYDDGTDTRYELADGVLVPMGTENPINPQIAGFLFTVFLSLGIPPYLFRSPWSCRLPAPSRRLRLFSSLKWVDQGNACLGKVAHISGD